MVMILVENLKILMDTGGDEKALKVLKPWYRGFRGDIYEESRNKWITVGCWHIDTKQSQDTIIITELPVGTWTDDYIEYLKKMETEGKILRYDDYSGECEVKIKVSFEKGTLAQLENNENEQAVEKYMKLTSNLNANNMHLIGASGEIVYMEEPKDILLEFYRVRSHFYGLRYKYLTKRTKKEINMAESKIKFIKTVAAGKLNMMKMKRAEITAYLKQNEYYETENFNYLLDMKMVSMSEEKVEALKQEIDKKKAYGNMLESDAHQDSLH